jgi:DNA primase
MNPEEKAKYKNSPETPIFSKRKELYNLHRALESMKDNRSCYIVEGYFDVMRMVVAGYPQAVAIMGTAFTKDQVGQLKRYAEEYNLILDGDEAGQKAMRDSRNVAAECNIYPHVILLPTGSDPDTYIKENGKQAFDGLIAAKEDLFLRTIKVERGKASDANIKFHRLEDVKVMLKQIKNPYRREDYTKKAAEMFGVAMETLFEDIIPRIVAPVKVLGKHGIVEQQCEKDFMSILMALSIESAVRLIDDMNDSHFEDEKIRELFKKVVELYAQSDNISSLINDPDVGATVADLLSRECGGADLYADAVKNKNQILLKSYQRERQALALKLAQTIDHDEKMLLVNHDIELRNTMKRLEAICKQ